jgi:hypothetical protein
MFPPTQELYKHEVPACHWKDITRHPVCGEARYNLTFRLYRDEYANPPKCKCGVPVELKPVLKRKMNGEGGMGKDGGGGESGYGQYYYTCVRGRPPGGCGLFEWLHPSLCDMTPL